MTQIPAALVRRASVTLTDADIKSLPTSWVQIIAAPGAGKVIVPLYSTWVLDATAGAYTNLQATATANPFGCSLYLVWDAPNFYNDASGPVLGLGFLNQSSDRVMSMVGAASNNLTSINTVSGTSEALDVGYHVGIAAGYENVAVYVVGQNNYPSNLGNFTGGNAANTLKVTAYYIILDL